MAPIALLLATALSGCTDPHEVGPAPPTSDEAGDPAMLEDGTPAHLVTYAFRARIDQQAWFNGSFKAQEHCFPAGCAPAVLGLAPPPFHVHDVSDLVPVGVPVWLTAEVRADLQEGDLDVWFNLPWQEVWTGRWDTPRGGYSRIEILVLRTGDAPVGLVVAYDEIEPAAEFAYSLMARVQAEPDRLAEAAPAALQLSGAGARLSFELEEPADDAAVLVWDPQDKPLLRRPFNSTLLEIQLPPEAPPGEYVVMLTDGTGSARFLTTTTETDPIMRPLAADVVFNMRDFEASNEIQWTYTADRLPLQTGIDVFGPTASQDFAATLASPTGPLLESTVTGGPWVAPFMGFGAGLWTRIGDARLAAGDYEATVRFETAVGPDPIHAMDFLVYYRR